MAFLGMQNVGGNVSTREAEGVRFAREVGSGSMSPGPGHYNVKDTPSVNYTLNSVEGSFGKEKQRPDLTTSGRFSSCSPGPHYDPFKVIGNKPNAAFTKAKRFTTPVVNAGYYQSLVRQDKPHSLDGTMSKSERNSMATATGAKISPGPKYNTRQPTNVIKSKNVITTLSRGERFPVSEDEGSPGPIYFPKSNNGGNSGHGSSAVVGSAPRFQTANPMSALGPGSTDPSTCPKKTPPSFSFGIKPKLWTNSNITESPGPIYNVKDRVAKSCSPAFSFAAPDISDSQQRQRQKNLEQLNASSGNKRSLLPITARSVGQSSSNFHNNEGVSVYGDQQEQQQQQQQDTATIAPSEDTRSRYNYSVVDNNNNNNNNNSSSRNPDFRTNKNKRSSKNSSSSSPQKTSSAHNTSTTGATTAVVGLDSPGPAHYMNVYKLFEEKCRPLAFSIGGVRRLPNQPSPGPGDYCPETFNRTQNKPKTATFSRAERQVFKVNDVSPGPVYNNEKWPRQSLIRHGVSTQTTNYTAKAAARLKADMESKEKEQLNHQLSFLQNDFLPCDDEFFQQSATRLDDVATRKDNNALVNVWY